MNDDERFEIPRMLRIHELEAQLDNCTDSHDRLIVQRDILSKQVLQLQGALRHVAEERDFEREHRHGSFLNIVEERDDLRIKLAAVGQVLVTMTHERDDLGEQVDMMKANQPCQELRDSRLHTRTAKARIKELDQMLTNCHRDWARDMKPLGADYGQKPSMGPDMGHAEPEFQFQPLDCASYGTGEDHVAQAAGDNSPSDHPQLCICHHPVGEHAFGEIGCLHVNHDGRYCDCDRFVASVPLTDGPEISHQQSRGHGV